MAPIYLYNGGILLRDGKVAVNQNCCCSSSSCCDNLNYFGNYYTVRINFSGPWGGTCTDVPVDISVYSLTGGVNCNFTMYIELDTVVCGDPEIPCGGVEVYLTVSTTNNPSSSSSTSCNCDTGENCQLQMTGYSPINCDGGIASVELIPPPPM